MDAVISLKTKKDKQSSWGDLENNCSKKVAKFTGKDGVSMTKPMTKTWDKACDKAYDLNTKTDSIAYVLL